MSRVSVFIIFNFIHGATRYIAVQTASSMAVNKTNETNDADREAQTFTRNDHIDNANDASDASREADRLQCRQ